MKFKSSKIYISNFEVISENSKNKLVGGFSTVLSVNYYLENNSISNNCNGGNCTSGCGASNNCAGPSHGNGCVV